MMLININIGGVTTALRTIRCCRILKLMKGAKFLQSIMTTLVKTVPSLGNIGGLLSLFLFIFSVLGMQLYSPVILQDN